MTLKISRLKKFYLNPKEMIFPLVGDSRNGSHQPKKMALKRHLI